MRHKGYDKGHTILVHEIIHQWLGNLFTIDQWDSICLQVPTSPCFCHLVLRYGS